MNFSYFIERRLLQRCADDDRAAQRQFATSSYRNQVYKTATEVNRSYDVVLGADELNDLCKLLIARIYRLHDTLPSWKHTLYRRIEDWVTGAVILYFNESRWR